ncbi:MAG TPA: dienelactone hydrolase family protein [Anaerolineales bacterium]|nr:dienelactone hydrolase family protein [Anaerolineales bacterium]
MIELRDVSVPGLKAAVLAAGPPVAEAEAVMVLMHGRGASADDIMGIAGLLEVPGFAYLAPQAAGNAWYPMPFTDPLEENEPYLSRSLEVIAGILGHLEVAGGPGADRTILLGFSQGACLALEFAARNPRRYGGLVGLSGGLIGPDGLERDAVGSLEGTPVFLGCSDVDPWIPAGRVQYTTDYLERIGGKVDLRIYPGMGHTIVGDELGAVRGMMEAIP